MVMKEELVEWNCNNGMCSGKITHSEKYIQIKQNKLQRIKIELN